MADPLWREVTDSSVYILAFFLFHTLEELQISIWNVGSAVGGVEVSNSYAE